MPAVSETNTWGPRPDGLAGTVAFGPTLQRGLRNLVMLQISDEEPPVSPQSVGVT